MQAAQLSTDLQELFKCQVHGKEALTRAPGPQRPLLSRRSLPSIALTGDGQDFSGGEMMSTTGVPHQKTPLFASLHARAHSAR